MFRVDRISDTESEEGAKDLSLKKRDNIDDIKNESMNDDKTDTKVETITDNENDNSNDTENATNEEKPLINPFLLYYLKVNLIIARYNLLFVLKQQLVRFAYLNQGTKKIFPHP